LARGNGGPPRDRLRLIPDGRGAAAVSTRPVPARLRLRHGAAEARSARRSAGPRGGRVIAYVSSEYLPHEQASLSIDDRGLMYGDSVFDVTRTFGGSPFRRDRHLQ